jgi:hypothetical protein
MKKIAILVIFLSVLNLSMAQDTAKIFINGKLEGTAIIKGDETISTVNIKKMKASLLKSVIIQTSGKLLNNAMYKKTIQAFDVDVLLFSVDEIKAEDGNISLPLKFLSKKLTAGKKIKLVLQLNPANDKMLMPSKIITLCFIMMK